jgi:acyl-CoA dehydrogenase
MAEHVYPAEAALLRRDRGQHQAGKRWTPLQLIEELKPKARAAGLWNLFLPESEARRRPEEPGVRAAGRDHGPRALGQRGLQLLGARHRQHGGAGALRQPEHKKRWLEPLLAGEIRSAFAMTEPAVASSDATNIEAASERDGDDYVINGRKWWTSGAGDPRCAVYIFMGKTDPRRRATRSSR